jgi:branched-chain amino acid transport system ATP-binding protein
MSSHNTSPLLIVEGLRVAYGGIQAVRGITFHINPGEMVALIGANGAGKTSTLKALARLLDAAGGSVRYGGKEIVRLPPHQLVGEGIALVPEGRGVFPRMSIVENLLMGAYCRSDKAEIARDVDYVYGLLPRLKERAQQLAGTLSGGEQQMLAIGRALMSRPKLLLLDEPSMGLAPIMVQKVFEVIQTVAREGMTTLLVEQNAKLALEVSSRGYVMESGEITLTDDSVKLLADPKVRAAYLGE